MHDHGEQATSGETEPVIGPRLRKFLNFRRRVWGVLPERVRRFIPESAVGFAMLNSCTFALDLLILFILRDVVSDFYPIPLPISLTIAYGVAFTCAFFLNRSANFLSQGHVPAELGRYVLTVLGNFVFFILGVSLLLTNVLGVHYQVARVLAGLCEAVFMFCTMKWFVFRRKDRAVVQGFTES